MKGLKIMTLGDLRKATQHLPDNTEIVLDEGDLDFCEARIFALLPPAHGHPWAVWIEMGQEVTLDKDLERRVDAYLDRY